MVQLRDAADDPVTVHARDPFKGLRLIETWLDASFARLALIASCGRAGLHSGAN